MELSARQRGAAGPWRPGRPVATPLFPPLVLPFAGALAVIAAFGNDHALAIAAIAVLLAGSALLWRPGEPAVLLYVFAFQWLQVSIGIFYASLQGIDLMDFLWRISPTVQLSTALSLVALACLATGIAAGAGPKRPGLSEHVRQTLARQPAMYWFKLYLAVRLVAAAAEMVAYLVPGLSQLFLAIASFKWAAFTIFTIATFATTNGSKRLWLSCFGLELVLSIGGYFSSYKDVCIYTLISLAAVGVRTTFTRAMIGGSVVALLLAMTVVWTAIKPDYRNFVSGGLQAQVVTVGLQQRWDKLNDLISQLDSAKIDQAVLQTVQRLSYVEFLAAVLDHVPDAVPHQHGSLWLDAITRPFMPRLFFPEKPVLDDSELTRTYTGLAISGSEVGTSISIGYVGESYIDFGVFGMMLPIFMLGYAMGRLYRWLAFQSKPGSLLGMSLAAPCMMTVSTFEIALAKTIGGFIVSALVALLIVIVVLPRVQRWLPV